MEEVPDPNMEQVQPEGAGCGVANPRRAEGAYRERSEQQQRRPESEASAQPMRNGGNGRVCTVRARVWLRDLTEEGIEPNPGPSPRFCSKNIDGISTQESFDRVMHTIAQEHKRDPLLAVALQEHHITRVAEARLRCKEKARAQGLLYIQAHRPDSEGKGGAALVIPLDSIERMPTEDHESAVKRVIATADTDPDGRWAAATTMLDGKSVTITSVYAHPDSRAAERPTFFNNLSTTINSTTLLGIDANCFPDPNIDAQSATTSQYRNDGYAELANAVSTHDLTDITRETLGNTTRSGRRTLNFRRGRLGVRCSVRRWQRRWGAMPGTWKTQ